MSADIYIYIYIYEWQYVVYLGFFSALILLTTGFIAKSPSQELAFVRLE